MKKRYFSPQAKIEYLTCTCGAVAASGYQDKQSELDNTGKDSFGVF